MTAAVIPPAIVARVGQLLRLNGSPIDDEALAACRTLSRTLGGAGLDLNTLADAVEHRADRIAQIKCEASGKPRRRRRAPPGALDLSPDRARQSADALSRASALGALSSWEDDFSASVVRTLRGSRPHLSARQIDAVERLMQKHGERR